MAAEQGCLKCHTVDGTRHIGPTWLDLYGRAEKLATGKTVVADEAYLTRSMMDPGAEIVAGYQNVMPTYQGKLSAARGRRRRRVHQVPADLGRSGRGPRSARL